MINPLICERCGRDLETDDAISIIEGVCGGCRRVEAAAFKGPTAPPTPSEPTKRLYEPATGYRGAVRTGGPTPATRAGSGAIVSGGNPGPVRERVKDTAASEILSGTVVISGGLPRGSRPFVEATWPGARGTASARPARRRRDLAIGVGTGIIFTAVFITYWLANGRETDGRSLIEPTREVALALTVKPPTARVLLDGEALASAEGDGRFRVALSGKDISAKWLEVSADGYYPIRRPVSVLSGIDDATIELVPMPFELSIRTDPPKAEVWLNGTLRGISPVTITSLPDEPVTLLLKRAGYADYVKEIAAPTTGGRLDLNLQLQPATPTLIVQTEPPGATIRINGKVAGVSPISAPVIAGTGSESANITVMASLEGFEPQERKVSLASMEPDRRVTTQFSLKPAMIEVRVESKPPGGMVKVDGRDVGAAPAWVKFEKSRVGQSVKIEASRGTAHVGSISFAVPATSRVEPLIVPMAFRGERVAFVLSPRAATTAEYATLLDQLSEQIHRLNADQQFAIIAATDEGVERWPTDGEATVASSGQKIRAYDMVRMVRPAKAAKLPDALNAAMAVEPGSVWLFVGGAVNRAALTAFAESIAGKNVAVHLVTTVESGDGQWLASWTARQGGTYTLLGRDPLPTIASGERGED